ncbi:hypothetical protein VTK56DRAFT_8781 [Thermocarpiscus australiensis]
MKLAAALSFAALAATVALEPRNCAGNNCNRAVTGTRPGLLPLTVRSAHCSSFLLTTVTPAATTVIVTVEEDDDDITPSPAPTSAPPVTVVPSSMPDYAAEMCNTSEYASACSCFGLTGSVTTAPTPTVTVTTTLDYCDDL